MEYSLTGVNRTDCSCNYDIVIENDGVIVFGDMTPFSSSTVDGIEVSLEGAGTADEITLEIRFPDKLKVMTLSRNFTCNRRKL